MRAESAETKIAAESKMAEACNMLEHAQKKHAEAEAKLHAAESLKAEANRFHRSAERKLQEVEAREDELRMRLVSFKFEYVLSLIYLVSLLYHMFLWAMLTGNC